MIPTSENLTGIRPFQDGPEPDSVSAAPGDREAGSGVSEDAGREEKDRAEEEVGLLVGSEYGYKAIFKNRSNDLIHRFSQYYLGRVSAVDVVKPHAVRKVQPRESIWSGYQDAA